MAAKKNMAQSRTGSARMRGRKVSDAGTMLPSTVGDQQRNAEPKVHRSQGNTLPRLVISFVGEISPSFKLLSLVVLAIVTIAWLQRAAILEERVVPRYVRHILDEEHVSVKRLDLGMELYPSKRTVYVSPDALEAQERLRNGGFYRRGRADPFETEECKAQYDWQLTSFPTCNTLFEHDLTNLHATSLADAQVRLIAHGYWRDVWMVREGHSQQSRVLKTLRYEHDYTPRNYERHRRDAVAMERLTRSPLVVNIYGFCGNAGLFEYADGGDITNVIWPKRRQPQNTTQLEKLKIATQVAMGMAATHNIDKEGQASVAHTDITPGQFVLVDGVFKLNDFNRARFLRWNIKENKPCGYTVGNNPGTNRAPEEYKYEEQSEKVDVYSMGNIFYMLLTSFWPFDDISEDEKAQKMVAEGKRPTITEAVWNSSEPIDVTLKEAMIMCHEQDPNVRATARQVETLLRKKLLELDPAALESWGLT